MSWRDDFAEILVEDRSLAELTYYGIGGRARSFLEPRDAAETAALLAALRTAGEEHRLLGGGANVLIDDGCHRRPFVSLRRLDEVEFGSDGRVRVGAGANFWTLPGQAARRGLAGLEGLAGIPGRMGGIVAMNAGGRYGEIADVIESVECALETGEVVEIPRAELRFGYRRCDLPPGAVTAATLGLEAGRDPEALRSRVREILKEKGAAQPLRLPSSGCVFVNPEGTTAGRLIESLGLKGLRRGGAEVSELHGNFIVNRGGARFADVLQLVERIEEVARERAGLELRREIRIWRAD